MKIVFLDSSTLGKDLDLSILNSFGEVDSYEVTSDDDIVDRCLGAEVVITNKVILSKDTLLALPELKLICIAATGMNNVDLEVAKIQNIEVKNIKDYSTNSVVQHTFTMLFYLMGSCKYYNSYVESSSWEKSPIFTNLDKPINEVFGKKWGIIGLGQIGKGVAAISSAFGCEIVYYSTSGNNSNDSYNRVELEELLSTCDIISIHAPLNNQTMNLLNESNLKLIKKGSVLLNLGRGGIINEADLVPIIKKEEILVGLDVLEKEPIQNMSPLNEILKYDNFYLSPHIAWSSVEARVKLRDILVDNLTTYVNSK
jgi:glycerate dehydrogenase